MKNTKVKTPVAEKLEKLLTFFAVAVIILWMIGIPTAMPTSLKVIAVAFLVLRTVCYFLLGKGIVATLRVIAEKVRIKTDSSSDEEEEFEFETETEKAVIEAKPTAPISDPKIVWTYIGWVQSAKKDPKDAPVGMVLDEETNQWGPAPKTAGSSSDKDMLERLVALGFSLEVALGMLEASKKR